MVYADKLFINGNFYSMKSEHDRFEALAATGDRIVFTGTDLEASQIEANEVIDLNGQTVIPGLNDTHLHFFAYCQNSQSVNLAGAKSIQEVIDRLREKAATTPKGEWIRGAELDQTKFAENRFPTRWELDEASKEHPIFISRYCMHAHMANSLALQIAGIDQDYKPAVEGTIEFAKNGEPTGIIREEASDLVLRCIPPALSKLEDKKRVMAEALRDAASHGITCFHTYGMKTIKQYEYMYVYQQLDQEGKLPVRMIVCFDELPGLGIAPGFGNNKVKYGTYKIFSDGSLGSRSAALLEPYNDCPESRGIVYYTQEELNAKVKTVYDMGLQPAIHAIGDRGLEMVLTAIENAYFSDPHPDIRFRIIHVQVTNEDQIKRMRNLPLVLDVQPKFVSSDLAWAEDRLGKERAKLSFAWKTLINNGLILTGSSDCPVEPYNPFLGIYAAVTRRDMDGNPEGGWQPQEKLTVYEALSMYTKNAAYASYDEKIRGTLEAGKLADFVVVDRDPFKIDPVDLKNVKVLKTYLGSQKVFNI